MGGNPKGQNCERYVAEHTLSPYKLFGAPPSGASRGSVLRHNRSTYQPPSEDAILQTTCSGSQTVSVVQGASSVVTGDPYPRFVEQGRRPIEGEPILQRAPPPPSDCESAVDKVRPDGH